MGHESGASLIEDFLRTAVSRRTALKAGAAVFLGSQLALMEELAVTPARPAMAAGGPTDIQFDIGAFIAPARRFNDSGVDVVAQFGPTFTLFAPARLGRRPRASDQALLAQALDTIEDRLDFGPSGVFVFVHWGLPYFRQLPDAVVRTHMPRLLADRNRFVLEESPVFPTDVSPRNPGIVKERFNVPVVIERNDVLFQLRSDSVVNTVDVLAWLSGSHRLQGRRVQSPEFDGLLRFQTPRLQFVQPGLPRRVADAMAPGDPVLYEYHTRINPRSPMVMGFADQQVDSSAPSARVVTFAGSSHAVLTTARHGDYFDNGCIAHFSHDIDDLFQFYSLPNQDPRRPEGEPYHERVQYMFRSNQLGTPRGLPATGNADQFTNGGGPAFVNNVFQGTDSAARAAADRAGQFGPGNQTLDATFGGEPAIGHEAALQRSSRAADGVPLHIRNDGPGFDCMDVPSFQNFPGKRTFPAGTNQFKLQFLIFVPTSEFFRRMRVDGAALDLQTQHHVEAEDNGLERFITATRRQNFLTPPRRHRSFPLLELT